MKSLNYRTDRNFADQYARECQRQFRMSSSRFYSQADKVRKPIVLAVTRSRADLNKAASRVLQSPRRLARISAGYGQDPVLLAAMAGPRAMANLSGVAIRGQGKPTMLETVAAKAAKNHLELAAKNPKLAKQLEARWAQERKVMGRGFMAGAMREVKETYGRTVQQTIDQSTGARPLVKPVQGWQPQGAFKQVQDAIPKDLQSKTPVQAVSEIPKEFRDNPALNRKFSRLADVQAVRVQGGVAQEIEGTRQELKEFGDQVKAGGKKAAAHVKGAATAVGDQARAAKDKVVDIARGAKERTQVGGRAVQEGLSATARAFKGGARRVTDEVAQAGERVQDGIKDAGRAVKEGAKAAARGGKALFKKLVANPAARAAAAMAAGAAGARAMIANPVANARFKQALKRNMADSPEATRSFLNKSLSTPAGRATAQRVGLDSVTVAAALGKQDLTAHLRTARPMAGPEPARQALSHLRTAELERSGADITGPAKVVHERHAQGSIQNDPQFQKLRESMCAETMGFPKGQDPKFKFGEQWEQAKGLAKEKDQFWDEHAKAEEKLGKRILVTELPHGDGFDEVTKAVDDVSRRGGQAERNARRDAEDYANWQQDFENARAESLSSLEDNWAEGHAPGAEPEPMTLTDAARAQMQKRAKAQADRAEPESQPEQTSPSAAVFQPRESASAPSSDAVLSKAASEQPSAAAPAAPTPPESKPSSAAATPPAPGAKGPAEVLAAQVQAPPATKQPTAVPAAPAAAASKANTPPKAVAGPKQPGAATPATPPGAAKPQPNVQPTAVSKASPASASKAASPATPARGAPAAPAVPAAKPNGNAAPASGKLSASDRAVADKLGSQLVLRVAGRGRRADDLMAGTVARNSETFSDPARAKAVCKQAEKTAKNIVKARRIPVKGSLKLDPEKLPQRIEPSARSQSDRPSPGSAARGSRSQGRVAGVQPAPEKDSTSMTFAVPDLKSAGSGPGGSGGKAVQRPSAQDQPRAARQDKAAARESASRA